jgi:TorA maturation chaperone TorD
MTTLTSTNHDVVESASRAVMYSLLAAGLGVPGPERWTLLDSTLIPAVRSITFRQPLQGLVADACEQLPRDLAVLSDEHMELFPPVTSSDAPAYETAYRGDGIFQQSALLADISGFYRAHGLRAGGSERERPDHIVVELEFMAVLMRKAVAAMEEDHAEHAKVCLDTAALFLGDHLACWAPAYGRRIGLASTSPWYRSLGRVLSEWVEGDAVALGVEPVEVVEEPMPFELPDDGECGPCVPGLGS